MKAKIDLEKFICSYVKYNNIQDALKDQGLKCWNDEIVEIPQESEDERIKKEILDLVSISGNGNQFEEIKDWLEKQGDKKSSDEVLKIRQEVYQSGYNDGYKHGIEDEKQGGQNLANSAKTCKNDTLLDLLNKMPSCITVDGINYHFVMAKHSYYIAYYKGNKEEYSGNAIFGVTSFSPIDLLTEMLDKLKKEGLLE